MTPIIPPLAVRGFGLLSALALAATPATAQLAEFHSIRPSDHSIPNDVFSNPVAGCFRVSSIKDVAYLSGNTLVLCKELGVFSDIEEIATGVTGLVVRRDDVLDQILALVNGVPRVMRQDASTGAWSVNSIQGAVGAQDRMIPGDVDGDGSDDLVTYSSNSGNVVGLKFQSPGSNTVSQYFSLSAPNSVLDVACLNWSGDSDAEIAILTGGKIDIFDQGGAQLATFSCPNGAGHLTTFRNAGETEDRLAWFWEIGTKNVGASVAWNNGQEGPYFLSSYGLGGVATGDYNADGLTDLVLTARTKAEGVILMQADWWHKSSPDSFTDTSGDNLTFELDTQVTGSARVCAAVLADVDNDQDLDVVQPDHYADEVAVFMSGVVYAKAVRGAIEHNVVFIHGWDEWGDPNMEDHGFSFDVQGPSYTVPQIGTPEELWVTVYVTDPASGCFVRDQLSTKKFPAQWGSSSTICQAEVALNMPWLSRDDGKIYCIEWRWASDQTGETRFYPSYVDLAVNTTWIAQMWEMSSDFEPLNTDVPEEEASQGGGGQMLAGPEPTPVFGPQPVCGTGRVPVPEPPPL